MIQTQLKLRLTKTQESALNEWLFMLTGVWNWAIRKIELDAGGGFFHTPKGFQNLLANHGKKLGIPSHTLQGTLLTAHEAWRRCFKGLAKKPRLKGVRNKLNNIPFPDPLRRTDGNRIPVPGLGRIRFHKQDIPEGCIKCGRMVKRTSGWYLCLFIDAAPKASPATGHGQVGIDPGYNHLLTLSNGEKIAHPRELERQEKHLAQAQRGGNKRLVSRLHERIRNTRRDRNHKLSRRLLSENAVIVFSADRIKSLQRTFGKSVASIGHHQLRRMLAYKCTQSGRRYIEVDSHHSTRTCSACGALSGPAGYAGLSVRTWACSACGAEHDRDVNAAVNTLMAGLGPSLEEAHHAV